MVSESNNAPRERQRLTLLPRTTSTEKKDSDEHKPSIFGDAKPRDEAAYLERKKALDQERKAKTKAEKEAKAKAKADAEAAALARKNSHDEAPAVAEDVADVAPTVAPWRVVAAVVLTLRRPLRHGSRSLARSALSLLLRRSRPPLLRRRPTRSTSSTTPTPTRIRAY